MQHGCGLQSAYKNRRYAPDLFLPIITQDFSPGTREGPGLSEHLRGPGRAWDSEEPTAAPTPQLRLLVLLGSADQQLLVREKALLKNQQDANPYCNGSISNIEDRPEKSKVVSTDSWNPLRISTRKQRKVKHIDHLTMQKGRVAATLR